MINLDFLHESGFKGNGITIGVFDAGFRNVDNMNGFKNIMYAIVKKVVTPALTSVLKFFSLEFYDFYITQ